MREEHALGELADVLAGVAVFWGWRTNGRREHRTRKAIHLCPCIVDVVLPSNVGSARLQQACHAVTERGPAGVADVERTGRVRTDELKVDGVAELGCIVAVVRAGQHDGLSQGASGRRIQPDVDEARPGHFDARDARLRGKAIRQQLSQLPRCQRERFGELERDAAGPVAVLA